MYEKQEERIEMKLNGKLRGELLGHQQDFRAQRNFLAPSSLLIALNMSIACGHLESQHGSLSGLVWLLRRSQGSRFLALCGCRWLTRTPASSAGCHLFWAGWAPRKSQAGSILPGKHRCLETQLRRFELTQSFSLPENTTGYKPFPGFLLINTQDTRLPITSLWGYLPLCSHTEGAAGRSRAAASLTLLSRSHGSLWKGKPLVMDRPCTLCTTSLGISFACVFLTTGET